MPGLGPAHIQRCCRLRLKLFFLGGGVGNGREDDDGALRLMIILRTHIAFPRHARRSQSCAGAGPEGLVFATGPAGADSVPPRNTHRLSRKRTAIHTWIFHHRDLSTLGCGLVGHIFQVSHGNSTHGRSAVALRMRTSSKQSHPKAIYPRDSEFYLLLVCLFIVIGNRASLCSPVGLAVTVKSKLP